MQVNPQPQTVCSFTEKGFFVTATSPELRGRILLGGGAHVVSSGPGERRRVDHRIGLLPGQQSTNPRAAEGEDPPHSCHSQKADKLISRETYDFFIS